MKIMAPLDNAAETEELIKDGADELYCGVFEDEWLKRYTIAGINRRVAKVSNLKSFNELKRCADIAHFYNVPICLTINEHYYTREQYPLLLEYIQKATSAGVDSFLVSDLALVLALKETKNNIPIHISTGGGILNSEAAKFYKSLGVSRVTMPRHLTIAEIEKIAREIPDLETTVFVLNARCPNVDALCTFNHIDPKWLGQEQSDTLPTSTKKSLWQNACMLPYSVELLPEQVKEASTGEEKGKRMAAVMRQQLWSRVHMDEFPCGICALYEFKEMGITTAKIVGRGNPTRRKAIDIVVLRKALALLQDSLSRGEYRKAAQRLHMFAYKSPCRTIMCYYPEVMPKESA